VCACQGETNLEREKKERDR